MHGIMTEELNSLMMRGSRFLKISVLSLLGVMALCLNLVAQSKAEGHYEMFEEVCEITGELKQRVVYHSHETALSVVETLQLDEE